MLSVAVEDSLAKSIDDVISITKAYSSRSEFLKDAIRRNIDASLERKEYLNSVRKETQQLAALARSRGWNGKLASRKEQDRVAREFAKEHGIKLK